MNEIVGIVVLAFLVLIGLLVIFGVLGSFIRIVREYERLVVFRLGRCIGERGPGLVILIPFIDNATKVDLREQFMEVPQQSAITQDNAPISVDFLIYWRVTNPQSTVLTV